MFLRFERPNAHMHVGAILLFDAGSLRTASGGVDVRRIRRHISAQLGAIPRYRQRLHPAPIDGQPVWVDDAQFDLDKHVRHVRLVRPGSADALHALAGRILSEPLDRRRPLWEMWLVDGLADGGFAVITKMHHCMVDGVAGADLLALLLTPAPLADTPSAPPWVPRPAPGSWQLVRERLRRRTDTVREIAAELWHGIRRPSHAREWARRAGALWQALGIGLRPAPDSPFNRPIGPHRRFAWRAVDLGEVKRIKNELGGTVNDVVLAITAGALSRFLRRRDPDAEPPDLRAFVPVNTRTAQQAGTLGNHVAGWIVEMPVSVRSPLMRFMRIRTMTAALKGTNPMAGAELLSEAAGTVLSVGVHALEWLRPFNLVVTNVPGPPIPLFLLGARLKRVFPLVPLFPNQGLGIAVFSYADSLCWGLNADCHVVPDLEALADAVSDAFAELAAAARPAAPRALAG